jgi:hypothetical protein
MEKRKKHLKFIDYINKIMGASCGTNGKKEGGSFNAPQFDPNLKIDDQGLKNVINDIESLI